MSNPNPLSWHPVPNIPTTPNTNPTRTTTTQQFQEKPLDDHTDSNGNVNGNAYPPPGSVRQRHQQRSGSHSVSRRDYNYNSAIGGYRSSFSDDTITYRSNGPDHHHHRRVVRHRLHQKHKQDGAIPIRLGWTKWMHSDSKNHVVAFMGEFVGTFMFLFFAFAGTQVANIGVGDSTNQVTVALALIDAISPLRAALLFIAQLTGATFSAYIVSILFPTAFNVRTTLAVGTSKAQGVFIEAICTAELVFTIIMLAREKHRATFIAPVGIGLALFISELVAVYYTGGSLNPARSFAPCAVTHDFDSDHWIYWVGPFIGSVLSVGFYKLNKILEYEMVNPGQDGDAANDPTQNPDHEVAQAVEERAIEVEEIQAVEEQGGFDNLSTDGSVSVAALDPDVMEADPVADLDRHVSGPTPETTKMSEVMKEDVEAQWASSSRNRGR